MGIKRPKPEEVVVKLRQVEVLMGQGMARIAWAVLTKGERYRVTALDVS